MDQAVVGEGSGVDKAVVGDAVVSVADAVSDVGDVGDLGGRGQTHQGGDNESLKWRE
jgi:hypothetical protein